MACARFGRERRQHPAIITAIVALAKALGMETVAEGVEAMDELNLVRDRDADLVQGDSYSRPMKQNKVLAQFLDGSAEHPCCSSVIFVPASVS